MANQQPRAKEEQIARARRLREQIQRMQKKQPAPDDAGKGSEKSLKEQIDERAAEPAKPSDRE